MGAETENCSTKVQEWGSDSKGGRCSWRLQTKAPEWRCGSFLLLHVPSSSFHCRICFFFSGLQTVDVQYMGHTGELKPEVTQTPYVCA